MRRSGANGLWFGGVSALPFPPLPLSPKEPTGWRTPKRFARHHAQTGLKWDVAVEVWAARNALRKKTAVVSDPTTEAYTRRLSLLDPGYRREALREIRRIVPTVRRQPYVNYYTGSDEPVAVLPRGTARDTPFGRRLARDFRRATGFTLPDPTAPRSRSAREGLRWLAWTRFSGNRFFAMKAEQAALIRRLDPGAVISPNDYGFIDGFIPWDYSRLAAFADIVEADPYVSYAERDRRGRGRYNPGFTAKLLSDTTGKRVRIVVQAFDYSRYVPQVGDLWTWAAQALRAGATDISFFASGNPRFTKARLLSGHCSMWRAAVRAAPRCPAPPVDPAQVVLYATGRGRDRRSRTPRAGVRYRTTGDALSTPPTRYWASSTNAAPSGFETDTKGGRIGGAAGRVGCATLWPAARRHHLDRATADHIAQWVQRGGNAHRHRPRRVHCARPRGHRWAPVRDLLVGTPPGRCAPAASWRSIRGSLAPGRPRQTCSPCPSTAPPPRAFAAVPPGASSVVARFIDGAPAVLARQVGAGRVLAFRGGDVGWHRRRLGRSIRPGTVRPRHPFLWAGGRRRASCLGLPSSPAYPAAGASELPGPSAVEPRRRPGGTPSDARHRRRSGP